MVLAVTTMQWYNQNMRRGGARVRMNAVEKSIYMRLVGGGKVGKNEVGAQDALMPKNLEGWLVMHAG